MNYKFCLLVMMFAFLLPSCSKFGKTQSDEIIFDDKTNMTSKNEIVIDDKSFDSEQDTVSISKVGSQEITKFTTDQSRINTAYDQFGNKTETRCFNNHIRLQCIILRTAADGQKQIFVYGQNGQVKSLPDNMIDKALTAPADEIANSAGIYQTYRQVVPVAQNTQTRNDIALRPLPSYNLPIQNQQVEQTMTEEVKPTADSANEKPSEAKSDSSTPPLNKEQLR